MTHSNLAFPLLKELCKVDDPVAKKVFKEEIIKRFQSGYPRVCEDYFDPLSKEERQQAFKNFNYEYLKEYFLPIT